MKLNTQNTALFYVIENKEQLIKETKKSIYHIIDSDEWIKDVNIFLVTPTNLVLDKYTKKSFTNIHKNTFFIEEDCVQYNDHVFFNMIYGADLAERRIPKEFTNLMYIDCDMYLLDKVPEEFDEDIIIEVEDDFNIDNTSQWLVDKNEWFKALKLKTNYYINTEFMIVKRDLNVFSAWLNKFEGLYSKLKILEKINPKLDISAMEESSFELTQYDFFNNGIKINYMKDFVARFNDPVVIPKDQDNVMFISSHIDDERDILFDYTEAENFVQSTYTVEIVYSCEYDCFFCEKPNLPEKKFLDFDTFKKYVNILADKGVTTIDLTPTKGDVITVPNLHEYIWFLEEHPKIKTFYFYTSLATMDTLNQEFFDTINNIKKGFMLYSCYFKTKSDSSDFIRITHTNQEYFDKAVENARLLFKNISKNCVFIDRYGHKDKQTLLSQNIVARMADIKKLEIIQEEDDLKMLRTSFLRDTQFCEQFLNCTTLKMDGDIVYCNYGKSYYNGVIENINSFENKSLLKPELVNSELCKQCLFKMESGYNTHIWNLDKYIKNHLIETSR